MPIYLGNSRSPGRTSKLQEQPQFLTLNMNFFHLFLWVYFAPLETDPAEQNQCRSMRIRIRIHNSARYSVTDILSLTLQYVCSARQ